MIENVMKDLGGAGLFGAISIVLFFGFFAGVLMWAWFLNRRYLDSMEVLPLDGGETEVKVDGGLRLVDSANTDKAPNFLENL